VPYAPGVTVVETPMVEVDEISPAGAPSLPGLALFPPCAPFLQ
jgi:hypothetical protein